MKQGDSKVLPNDPAVALPDLLDHAARRRPGVLAVHSVQLFVFSVPDLDEAAAFYAAFGLDVRRVNVNGPAGEHIELRTFSHAHVWATVHAGVARKRLDYVSYGIDAADLPAWRAKVLANGLACEPHPLAAAQPAADDLWLRNPDGTPVQLVIGPKVSPSGKRAPAGAPSQISAGIGAAPARSKVSPVQPSHLSHVLFFTPDVKRMVAFCRDVLGMRLSDHSGDLIAFVHGVHGSDHHLVAFAKSHAPGLHHSSWDVASINEVGLGSEQMRNAGHTQGWGVGRHVLGSNYFYYVRDPWGSYAEFSHDIDFVPADVDWPAADHPPHDSLYVWGPALPEDFITNHEQPAGAST